MCSISEAEATPREGTEPDTHLSLLNVSLKCRRNCLKVPNHITHTRIHTLPLTSVEAVSDPLWSQSQTGVHLHAQHCFFLFFFHSASSPPAKCHVKLAASFSVSFGFPNLWIPARSSQRFLFSTLCRPLLQMPKVPTGSC